MSQPGFLTATIWLQVTKGFSMRNRISLSRIQSYFGQRRLPLFLTQIVALALPLAASLASGQAGAGQTVIQKATEQFENSPLRTTAMGNGLFMFSGDGGNVTAIVDNASTLLIDSGIDSRVTELSDAVFKTTGRAVTRLVNTHWHFDHTGGNVYFGSEGVTLIAQENVKKRMASVQDVPFTGIRDGHYPSQALPAVTYSSSTALQQGSQQLTLVNYGPSHTDGDTVVYISPANVAVVGDIFSNHVYPIIDLVSGGSIDGMIQSLNQILAKTDEQTKIVPGHGPITNRAALQDYRDMLVQVRQRIKVLISAGKTIDEVVAAAPTKDFDSTWGGGYVAQDVFIRMVFSSLTNTGSASR
jgi:cyclase